MPRVAYNETSLLDFQEIWDYIADDNEAAADRLISTFEKKLCLLATMPTIGKDEADLAPNLRSFPVGNYILFYREISDGIQLIRALHCARDISTEFFGDE